MVVAEDSAKISLRTSYDVVGYLKKVEADLPITVDGSSELSVDEVTGGNLNFSFRAYESANPERSVFVKQAPSFIKCLGEDYKLDSSRANLEGAVLRKYGEIAPGLVPRLFYMDEDNCVMILEWLAGHAILRDALVDPSSISRVTDVVDFMSLTHNGTRGMVDPGLTNPDMCSITSDYVFTKPFDETDPTNCCAEALGNVAAQVRADEEVVAAMKELRGLFETSRDCLVHGDLHTGSVMVPISGSDEGHARVIDAEFAHIGCAAFDVGSFLAHLFFAALACVDGEAERRLVNAARGAWETYRVAAKSSPETLQHIAGFTGCEMVRRVIGAAHAPEIDSIQDDDRRAEAESRALRFGASVMKKFRSMEEFEEMADLFHETQTKE